MKVVIVGGGVIGCSTAYFLSLKSSCQVTLVEQCEVAAAASGKAGGFLARDWCSGPLDVLARRSFDLHA
jgi:glycine/D-amino acid oxidase-like deaminating enzyme